MPPKVRVTKENIIKTATELVRQSGAGAINARAIASALGCSTQPIFSNFATMDELKVAVIQSAQELFDAYTSREIESRIYPEYKATGMAYIRFAKEEKELFKLLYMRDRSGEDSTVALEFEAGEGKRSQHGDNKRKNGRYDTNVHRVEEQPTEVCRVKGIHVVGKHELLRPEGGNAQAVFCQILKGGDDHPVEGEEDNQRHNKKKSIEEELHEDLNDSLLGGGFLHVFFMHGYRSSRHTVPP